VTNIVQHLLLFMIALFWSACLFFGDKQILWSTCGNWSKVSNCRESGDRYWL